MVDIWHMSYDVQFMRLWGEGHTYAQIAEIMAKEFGVNLSFEQIKRRARTLGLPSRRNGGVRVTHTRRHSGVAGS